MTFDQFLFFNGKNSKFQIFMTFYDFITVWEPCIYKTLWKPNYHFFKVANCMADLNSLFFVFQVTIHES